MSAIVSKEEAAVLLALAENEEAMEVARKAVEDVLVEWRDSRLSQIRGNGLVIAESDGTPSDVIRFGMEVAMKIGLKAIAKTAHSSQSLDT